MAAILGGLNVFAKTFRAAACLQRCLRPCTFEISRCLATERHKTKLDEKPKRAATPFFIYYSSIRAQLVEQNPGKKVAELSKLAAAQYRELSDAKKEELRLQYEEKKAEWEKANEDFLAGCSEEELGEMKKERAKRRKKRKARRLRAENREMMKPKQPLTSYMRFLQECRESDLNNIPDKVKNTKLTEYSKEIGALWKKMSPAEKQPYIDEYKKERVEYMRKLQTWEALMLQQDKIHLVRIGHHLEPERQKKKTTKKRATRKKKTVTSKKTAANKKTATRKKNATKKKTVTRKKKATREKEHELENEHELSDSDSD